MPRSRITLQDRHALRRILEALRSAGAAPLLVKLSPELSASAVEEVLTVVDEFQLEGIVATNTTTTRPPWLRGRHRAESGGLSGEPLEGMATRMVRFIAERTRVPVIGVGGVSTAEAAYTKIRAGASLVQLYTALVYSGPGIARQINEGLLDLLERDGLGGISEAVGADL